jgi:hypothetical protein
MTRLLVSYFLLFSLQLAAQESSILNISNSSYYAYIIPHSRDIEALASSNPVGTSISLAWQSGRVTATASAPLRGKKGFRLAYTQFGNPAQLGNAFHLTAFTEPFLGSSRKLFVSFPIDAGMSYLSKVYHPKNNPENLFFGSHLSFYLGAGIQLQYKCSEQFLVHTNVSYQHVSNGGIKMPNKGMNFPSVSLGASYYLQKPNWQPLLPIVNSTRNKMQSYKLFMFASFKTVPNPNTLVPLGGAQFLFTQSINNWHHMVVGSELVHNTYKKEFFARQNTSVQAWENSLQAGYELRVGKTSLLLLLGADILNDKRLNSFIYQRYGLLQKISNKWFLAGTLKSNGHVADIFDVRLGYQLY